MDDLSLFFFGGFTVERAGMPLHAFESDKVRLLFAYLAIENGQRHRRERLAGLFWPEKPAKLAHHSLSQALSSLKKLLAEYKEDSLFEITPRTVFVHLENVRLDVIEFEDQIRRCKSHDHYSQWTCQLCLDRLEQAAVLYRGDLLAGLSLPDCQVLEEWLVVQQESFRQEMLQVTRWLSQGYEAAGDYNKALFYANRTISLEPYDETGHRQVMSILVQLGQRAAALSHYEAYQKLLVDELDISPQSETITLYQQLRQTDQKVSCAKVKSGNLPTPLLPLIGRQSELKQLRLKMLDPTCRLLTLLGVGGVGKTSLALEVGRSMQAYVPDGVYLVELDTQESSLSLLPQIAQAVGLDLQILPDSQSEGHLNSTFEQVCGFLQQMRLLLILDGFEGLLHEADQVERLLHNLPDLRIMVTSRARLNLAIEQIFLVEGLACPVDGSTDLASFSAVQLFCKAAQRSDPEFGLTANNLQAVAGICSLNSGIPLGILLAAAWVEVLTPAQIVAEIQSNLDFLAVDLNDLPERQRSLRATFNYSWRLLSPENQVVYMRLSVLHGVFTAEQAQQLAGADLKILKSLIDQVLVQRIAPDCFRLHDLLRQYALERLASSPNENAAIRFRHCQLFLEKLASLEVGLKSASQPRVRSLIDQEYADILAAWDWALAHQQVRLLENAVETLKYYHEIQGLYVEGAALSQRSIHRLESMRLSDDNIRLWVCLRIWLGWMDCELVQCDQAWQLIREVEQVMHDREALAVHMRREKASLSLLKGEMILTSGGDTLVALNSCLQGLEMISVGESLWDISYALIKVAAAYTFLGNLHQMGHFVRKALEIQRDLGDPVLIAEINSYLGYFYMLSGEYTTALQVIEEQAANQMRIKNRYSLLSAKQNLSNALLYAGQYDQAHELSTQAAALVPDLEPVGDPQFNQFILTLIDLHRGEYTAVLQEAAFGGKAISKIHQVDIGFLKAQIYLLYGEWDQAEMGLKGFYDLHRSFPHLGMIGLPLALLGYIEYRRGNFKGALDNEEVALVIGLEQGYFLVNLYSLAVLALMAAEAGELEEAVELYATVTAHPCAANSRLFIDLFENPLAALTADLPEEISMAARERGSRRSLSEGANEYLHKLRVHKVSFENLFLKI